MIAWLNLQHDAVCYSTSVVATDVAIILQKQIFR